MSAVSTLPALGYSPTVAPVGRQPAVGRVAITIDDDLHARARSLQIRQRVSWEQWVEDAIRERTERLEAERAEQERKRRSR